MFSVNNEEKDIFEKKRNVSSGKFVNPVDDPAKATTQDRAKVLQNINTFFYIGTEVGGQEFGEFILFLVTSCERRTISTTLDVCRGFMYSSSAESILDDD